LENHNFSIFRREEDQSLRNKIAHHDFCIDDEGVVKIKGKVIDVGDRFGELSSFALKVYYLFCECLKEVDPFTYE
jgi:hypothetical protein